MKKFILLSVFSILILINNNAGAFYIWQDFDNPNFPPAGWTLSTTNAFNWDWSIMCSGYGSGFGSLKGNSNDALSGLSFDITTPQFTSAVTGDSVIFDYAYAAYSASPIDSLKIWYSTDNGSTWFKLVVCLGGTTGDLVTAPPTGLAFVPTASQWGTKRYAIPTGTNKLKFTCYSGCNNNMYFDNIKIGQNYTNDVGAVGFKRFIKAIPPSAIDTPKVTVRNFGNNVQTFPVTLTITPGSYTSTQTVTGLAPGATYQVTFPQFTAPASGNIVMKAYTALTGEQNASNDTIYNNYVATNNGRNLLIEYCTGTWCQWCPCAKVRIMQFLTYYPNTIVLAYHGGSTADPYQNFNGNNIITLFGMNAYPTGTLDRLYNPNGYCGYSSFVETSFMRYLNSPVSPVKIEIITQNYNASTHILNVTLKATALSNLTGQYLVNYVITEDNLVYTQQENTYCPGGASYVHHWVVRNMINNALGDSLNSGGTWNNNVSFTKSFSTTLNTGWVDANCRLKMFVYKNASPLYNAEVQSALETSIAGTTGIVNPPVEALKFELLQNYPNPFNPVTNIKFTVPKDGHASLNIFDITGKLVATYLNDYVTKGVYNAEIDGTNLSSGVYFYTLKTDGFTDTKKMVLIK